MHQLLDQVRRGMMEDNGANFDAAGPLIGHVFANTLSHLRFGPRKIYALRLTV
jgi:hypothetical protein